MGRALHILVSGRVQGVGFRYFVREQAQRLSLSGWVRNLRDGRVEILVVGDALARQGFLQKVHQGPLAAEVARVEFREVDGEADHESYFAIHPDSEEICEC